MTDRIRDAIQQFLNSYGDGWTVTQYVVAMGLERIGPDGEIEATGWFYAPPEQADWQTTGLLNSASDLHYANLDDEGPL